MKPEFITKLEQQLGVELNSLSLDQLDDSRRHRWALHYVADGERILSINLAGFEAEFALEIPEKVCATLVYLNLSNSALRNVEFSGPLKQLRWLDLSRSQLSELAMPEGCDCLEQLWLQRAQLSRLKFSSACSRLELMDISHNPLAYLQLPFGFAALSYLYACECQLEKVDFQVAAQQDDRFVSPVPALNTLHLADNRLHQLPVNIVFGEQMEALYLGGNVPGNFPFDMVGKHSMFESDNCLKKAQTFFAEFRKYPEDVRENRTTRVMVTGNGNVGKSTLVHALIHGECFEDKESTHGVLLEELKDTDAAGNLRHRFQFWDFGGQEIYHRTHRLFLAAPAVQLVVFDQATETMARENTLTKDRKCDDQLRNDEIEYWLESAAELSPKSQFILVQNLKGDHNRDDAAYYLARERSVDFWEVNARTGKDVDGLHEALRKLARKLPDYGLPMPKSWIKVREFFDNNVMQGNHEASKKLISLEAYYEVCDQHKVLEASREVLLSHLHHNGYVYYSDHLEGQIIADQRWALDAIYALLDRGSAIYKRSQRQKGFVWEDDLMQAFDQQQARYSPGQKQLLVNFMLSCGLCFELNTPEEEKDRVFVFPEFLTEKEPAAVSSYWDARKSSATVLRQQLKWVNLPQIQRFIVKFGRSTDPASLWRYGIQVVNEQGVFCVRLDRESKQLLVYLETSAAEGWAHSILRELDISHSDQSWEISVAGEPFKVFSPHKDEQGYVESEAPERMLTPESWAEETQAVPRKAVLIVSANPTDKVLNANEESQAVFEKLAPTDGPRKFEVTPRANVSGNDVIKLFKAVQPSVFHFIGHGRRNRNGASVAVHDAGNPLQERGLSPASLRSALALDAESTKSLELVIFNACESAESAQELSRLGVYAIGYADELDSQVATNFSREFYEMYEKSLEVEDAFTAGLQGAEIARADSKKHYRLFRAGELIRRG